jgi:hypothetical protein
MSHMHNGRSGCRGHLNARLEQGICNKRWHNDSKAEDQAHELGAVKRANSVGTFRRGGRGRETLTATLTTIAFDDSSLRWLEINT